MKGDWPRGLGLTDQFNQHLHRVSMPSVAPSDHQAVEDMRTVVVLGASYAGYTGAQTLSTLLPRNWRVIVIERNTHANRKTF
jgi:hypothetical protein